jgi:DNA-directed RNA polymerase delta subunit
LAEARFLVFGKDSGAIEEHLKKFKDVNLKEALIKFPEIQKEFVEIFGYKAEKGIRELKDYEEHLNEDPGFIVLEFSLSWTNSSINAINLK